MFIYLAERYSCTLWDIMFRWFLLPSDPAPSPSPFCAVNQQASSVSCRARMWFYSYLTDTLLEWAGPKTLVIPLHSETSPFPWSAGSTWLLHSLENCCFSPFSWTDQRPPSQVECLRWKFTLEMTGFPRSEFHGTAPLRVRETSVLFFF